MGVFRNNVAIVKAQSIKKRYTLEEFREAMRLTEEQMAALDAIAAGKPPRNAMAILKAIELKAEYAYEKPKSSIEHSGAVNVTVQINRAVPKDE